MAISGDIVRRAKDVGLTIPAFNMAHLPMVEPVVRAVADQDSFAFLSVSRIDWEKFGARSPAAAADEFRKWDQPGHIRLHLDHVPVLDEDDVQVDYVPIIQQAIAVGYQSVMVDGSRLGLEANIEATRRVAELAHEAAVPCEAELGAVFGHESGPPPPYEELFESGMGFTDTAEAERFVKETGCDWLSVAIGNVHGAVSDALRDRKKVEARLDLDHLDRLRQATGVPLVLHGGSGVQREYVLKAIKRGIAKVNIGTEIRQAYESSLRTSGSVTAAQDALYECTCSIIRDYLGLSGSSRLLTEGA